MALDLFLLVFCQADGSSLDIANTMIEVVPDEELATALLAIEKDHGRPVNGRFMTYTSREAAGVQYGNTQTTPYGEPLRWLPAKLLMDKLAQFPVDALAINRAAWAYLKALPVGYGVALYWH